MEPQILIKIANTQMPFGKYKGIDLINIPEEYFLWFQNKGFPPGELGELMAMTMVIKMENLSHLIKPLKR
ncbi:DUF3820 family protein [Catenovulum sp. SX2]|uniref:DUF3820 family protein n=1 Tax=Catenovulum sp. SX2 TaxID=3398614 RepID=UPI003F8307E7